MRTFALTEMFRGKFIEGGLPSERIFVKPNYAEDPGEGQSGKAYVAFVGRLSHEKGIHVLLEAWRELQGIPLLVVGDGPMADFAHDYTVRHRLNATFLGHLSHPETIRVMREIGVRRIPIALLRIVRKDDHRSVRLWQTSA